MNKKLNIMFILAPLVLASLVSCGENSSSETSNDSLTTEETTSSTNPTSSSTTEEEVKTEDIFISELITSGISGYIEIGNNTGKIVNLDGYKLNIYKYDKLSVSVDLSGKSLENNKVLVFSNKSSDKYNGDQIYLDDDYITGRNHIELVKNNVCIDSISYSGYNVGYFEDVGLIRFKESYYAYPKFDLLNFFEVKQDVFTYLGTLDVNLTMEEFLKGPKINESYLDLPFSDESAKGKGGFIKEAHLVSLGDGDTTGFKELDQTVRYLLIDTPEMAHGEVIEQPWARAAKKYNNRVLTEAKHIMIQSNLDYPLNETYGRYLGYVWYTDLVNPQIEDYRLLNYEMVFNGLARENPGSFKTMFSSDEINYSYYVKYAGNYCTKNKIGVHGDPGNDPNYDYSRSTYIGD